MFSRLARLFGKTPAPSADPEAAKADAILGDFAVALGDDVGSFDGDTRHSADVPLAPRDPRASYAALEPEPLAERSPAPDGPTEGGALADAKTGPPAGSTDKGWDLLKEDSW